MKTSTKIGGAAGLALGAVVAVADLPQTIDFVGSWEGLELKTYLDPIGIPTVCYGETKGVKMGQTYTKAQCDAMLARRLVEFEAALDKCLTKPVPTYAKIAFVSHAYNVGSSASCNSTMVRKANTGDLMGACAELPKWNKAGGKTLFGLVRRRAAERVLCEAGVTGKPFEWSKVMS